MLPACTPGVATDGDLYPRGSFVAVATNPRVLHYDKELYGTPTGPDGTWEPVGDPSTAENKQHFTRDQLRAFFADNVRVGTCGSGQEQGLEAARLAIAKGLSGKQRDTRSSTGAIVPSPGVTADWPHAGAKLVVVYVGDEDDCSSPEDPFKGVVLVGPAGNDTCVDDALERERPVADFVNDLKLLQRPLGAAFVVSATLNDCVDETCTAAICSDMSCGGNTSTCGGQAPGARFLDAARLLRLGGSDVVSASICDAGFGTILGRIAEIVKPPSALELPTRPADAQMTVLRITSDAGVTRKFCVGPALPPTEPPLAGYLTDPGAVTSRALAYDQARTGGYDWWFTETRDQIDDADKAPWSPTTFVYINHATNNCEPNPGEIYSAEYLGMLPSGSGCQTDADCDLALGTDTDWTCFAGLETSGLCRVPTLAAAGTCVCSKRAEICPLGP
jgi:hypothetical protein